MNYIQHLVLVPHAEQFCMRFATYIDNELSSHGKNNFLMPNPDCVRRISPGYSIRACGMLAFLKVWQFEWATILLGLKLNIPWAHIAATARFGTINASPTMGILSRIGAAKPNAVLCNKHYVNANVHIELTLVISSINDGLSFCKEESCEKSRLAFWTLSIVFPR